MQRAVDAASDDERRLQIAVVVPGLGAITPVLLFDDDDFSAQIDGNVRPIYLFLKYAGQAMVRAGGGSFVAISSTAAVFSTKYLASYAAGKAAVDQLVRVAANELGELGVRVNSVQPGMTRTPGTARAFDNPEMMAAFLAEQPIARHGEVEDIAQAVRYFAGPESSWVTGQLLTVDGGNTLRSFIDYRQPHPPARSRRPRMNRAPKTTEAFDELIAALTEIRDGYVLERGPLHRGPRRGGGLPLRDRGALGHVGVLRRGRCRPPAMAMIVNPARKMQGDNPDAIYHFAQIRRGSLVPRLRRPGEESYISFTVHSEAVDGGFNGRVLADINDSQFTFAPDGSYEIVFSAEPERSPTRRQLGELDPDARMLIVRSYFLREQSAQNDPAGRGAHRHRDARRRPHRLPARRRHASGACRAGVAFLRQTTLGQPLPGQRRRRRRSWARSPTRSANRGASATRGSTPPVPSTSSIRWVAGTSGPTTRSSCAAPSRRRASPT